MAGETPKPKSTPAENQPLKDLPLIVGAEIARTALGIEEKPAEWKALMEKVMTSPENPNETKIQDPLIREELHRRYRSLEQLRQNAAKGLLAAIGLQKQNMRLSDLDREAILVALARFLDEREVYSSMWRREIPRHPDLPQYLAKYLHERERELMSFRVTEALLPMQYDVVEDAKLQPRSPRMLAPQTKELLLGAIRHRVRMEDVLPCIDQQNKVPVDDPKPFQRLLTASGFKNFNEEDVVVAKFLVGYIAKNLDSIKKSLKTSDKTDLNQLTMGEALEALYNPALGSMASEIAFQVIHNRELPDVRTFMKKIFDDTKLYQERVVELALEPLVQIGADPAEKQQFRKNAAAVAGFCLGVHGSNVGMRRVEEHYPGNLNESQQDIANKLRDAVANQGTIDALLRGAFVEKGSDLEKEITAALQPLIIQKNMKMRDAFEIHFLRHAGGQQLPLGMKLIDVLKTYGHTKLSNELQIYMLDELTSLTLNIGSLEKIAQKLQLDDRQQRELKNVTLFLKDEGLERLANKWDLAWAFIKAHPYLVSGGVIVIGIPTYLKGRRYWVKWDWQALERITKGDPTMLAAKYRVSAAQIRLAQEEIVKLHNAFARLDTQTSPWPLERLQLWKEGNQLRNQAHMYLRGATSTELTDITKALRAQYGNVEEVSRYLSKISDDSVVIEQVLRGAKFTPQEVTRGLQAIQAARAAAPEAGRFASIEITLTEMQQQLRQLQVANRQANLKFELERLSHEYDDITRATASMDPQTRLTRFAHLEPRAKQLQQMLAQAGSLERQEFDDLARQLFPGKPLQKADLDALWDAHAFGGERPAQGWSQAQLTEKIRRAMATGNITAEEARKAAQVGLLGRPAQAARTPSTLGAAERGVTEAAQQFPRMSAAEVTSLRSWLRGSWFHHAIMGTVLLHQADATYADIREALQSTKDAEKADKKVRTDLESLAAVYAGKDTGFLKISDEQYGFVAKRGEEPLFTISVESFNTQAKKQSDIIRAGTSSAALLGSIGLWAWRGSKLAGPVGWGLTGVEVTVRVGVNAWEFASHYDFLAKCPPWLLAKIGGTKSVIGRSEAELGTQKICDFPIEVWKKVFDKETQTNTLELRKKMMFSAFMAYVQSGRDPKLQSIMTPLLETPELAEQFLREDFEKIVLPLFHQSFFMNNRLATRPWADVKNLLTYSLEDEEQLQKDMDAAIVSAADGYRAHLQQKMNMETARRLTELTKNPDDAVKNAEQIKILQNALFLMQGDRVLGASLSALDPNAKKTNVEELMGRFGEMLDRNPNLSWKDMEEKIRSMEGDKVFTSSYETVAGKALSKGRNFSVVTRDAGNLGRERWTFAAFEKALARDREDASSILPVEDALRIPPRNDDLGQALSIFHPHLVAQDQYAALKREGLQLMEAQLREYERGLREEFAKAKDRKAVTELQEQMEAFQKQSLLYTGMLQETSEEEQQSQKERARLRSLTEDPMKSLLSIGNSMIKGVRDTETEELYTKTFKNHPIILRDQSLNDTDQTTIRNFLTKNEHQLAVLFPHLIAVRCDKVDAKEKGDVQYLISYIIQSEGNAPVSFQQGLVRRADSSVEMGLMIRPTRTDDTTRLQKGLLADVALERGRVRETQENTERLAAQEFTPDAINAKVLAIMAKPNGIFEVIAKDAKSGTLYGVRHEGRLLLCRESGGSFQYALVETAGKNAGEAGDPSVVITAFLKPGKEQAELWQPVNTEVFDQYRQERQANVPALTPDLDILLQKILAMPREGEAADKAVDRLLRFAHLDQSPQSAALRGQLIQEYRNALGADQRITLSRSIVTAVLEAGEPGKTLSPVRLSQRIRSQSLSEGLPPGAR